MGQTNEMNESKEIDTPNLSKRVYQGQHENDYNHVNQFEKVNQMNLAHPTNQFNSTSLEIKTLQKKENKNPRIAVLLPCYNEEITVFKVVKDFQKALPEADIYVFDNCSKDKTAQIAREAGAKVVYSPHQGKGNVVRHMFDTVEADIYLMCDGDDTYPAENAPRLISLLQEEGLDMVIGSRMEHFEGAAFRQFHQFGNHLVAFLISTLFPTQVTDVLSGLRVFSPHFVKTVPLFSRGFQIETEMTLQAVAKNFRIKEIPINFRNRPEGSFSKLNTFSDGILVIRAILMIFKDYRPLVFYTLLGFLFVALSLLAGYLPIMDYYQTRYVSHVPLAILAASLGVLSILSLMAGLILDTVSKYHHENFLVTQKLFKLKSRNGLDSIYDEMKN